MRIPVVFDIYGTLLDETGSLRSECSAVLGDASFGDAWDRRTGLANRETRLGQRAWIGSENLRRAVLAEMLTERGLAPDGAEFDALAHVAHRFEAFPGAAAGLDGLARVATVIGLTNTDLAAVAEASSRAGLRWHALLSTQLARTFKPDERAYRLVEDLLRVEPARGVFVAAHPWDLRAAAERGWRTAYLPRDEGQFDPAGFDHVLGSLDDLVALAEEGGDRGGAG